MFDIGFWELAVIGVVALLVIGPERLPRVARTTGLWLGRARRFVSGVKADIDREIAADELKKAMAKQMDAPAVYDIIEDTKQTIQNAGETPAEPVPAEEENKAVTRKPNDASG